MSAFIQKILWEIINQNASETETSWLTQKSNSEPLELMTAFVACPRFLSKKLIIVKPETASQLNEAIAGFSVEGWSLVRLARVWLLTHLDASDKETYIKHINTLFDTAEMNELVALYSALPILTYPEQWLFRATDAVRSNMGFVFDAIALRNPYPAKYFNEAAWNQLVMKTIFNDKPIHFIDGLNERQNKNLALILSDFAHERWAAGRSVAPQVWRLTSSFLDETLLSDIQHLLKSGNIENQQVAAIASVESGYQPAIDLLAQYPELKKAVASNELTWADFETKDLNTYVPKP
ncbi:EboA domain-containing protein [Dyadobacter sp. CY312]|uniref:EboA domain-containing protein n=1 Tax=Dyadobacter sp. CY312 TaxID=2907303 RepID=UPI001F3046F8|nr:EboA domain-containing protein [Dyadobacter sp. CY312]MCE7043371.1 EboA domain-containing protein [Dyadobacter sp. CY312]